MSRYRVLKDEVDYWKIYFIFFIPDLCSDKTFRNTPLLAINQYNAPRTLSVRPELIGARNHRHFFFKSFSARKILIKKSPVYFQI